MKTRRSRHKNDDFKRKEGSHGRRGGAERGGRPPAPRPTRLIAQVQDMGLRLVGKVLHRDLVSLEFALEVPEGMVLAAGDYIEGLPIGGRGERLEVVRKVPEAGVASLAAICNHGLSLDYPKAPVEEAEGLPAFVWDVKEGRTDWRKLAFVTIDGEDARDFDDAVWAEDLGKEGFRAMVAIADVAHYIKEDGKLDAEAVVRGNSTYFPDRVLPMLPERLSNDLCSLRPKVDRPVLGVEMWIDGNGHVKKYKFARGCIHSHARLTYNQVEDVLQKRPHGLDEQIVKAIGELRKVYDVLARAKEKRGALDLDLPEVKLELGKDGKVKNVGVRPRLISHRLIEEFMITANVAAADALSKNGGGALYRIHPEPSKEKMETLRATMGPLGFTTPAPNGGPKAWAKLVEQVHAHPAAQTLMRSILQSQQQAKYDPDNIGHYGLALALYSHFTSPIRRYADLVVHRALIEALKLKGGGGAIWPVQKLARIAEGINLTERKSQMAEWEARDRMVAQHFAGLVGKEFTAIVVGVQPFGCFVAVEGVAEGLLPKWLLGFDWAYIGGMNAFRRVKNGKGVLRVGSKVDVKLREADPLGGRLTFAPKEGGGEDRLERGGREGGAPRRFVRR